MEHGDADDEVRHAGDLGNILADSEGEAVFSMEIPTNTTLYGRHSIIGRTFVIHGGVDPASGNAGPRMACGIVESEKVDTYFGKQLKICK